MKRLIVGLLMVSVLALVAFAQDPTPPVPSAPPAPPNPLWGVAGWGQVFNWQTTSTPYVATGLVAGAGGLFYLKEVYPSQAVNWPELQINLWIEAFADCQYDWTMANVHRIDDASFELELFGRIDQNVSTNFILQQYQTYLRDHMYKLTGGTPPTVQSTVHVAVQYMIGTLVNPLDPSQGYNWPTSWTNMPSNYTIGLGGICYHPFKVKFIVTPGLHQEKGQYWYVATLCPGEEGT